MTQGLIRIRGARQHNLRNLDIDIRTGELTGVKHGNHWRVPTAALTTWIDNHIYTP